VSIINLGRRAASSLGLPPVTKAGRFLRRFNANLAACDWEPHPLYSVFTQFDQSHYLAHREAFVHKYKCFWAVSRTISPRSIVEIGPHAGSSADAYLSATRAAEYLGVDKFCNDQEIYHEATGERWLPVPRLHKLFAERGFKNYELLEANLRDLKELPRTAEMVVVDAAHDPFNEYEDLKLAMTARPRWLFIDDAAPQAEAWPAIERFLDENRDGISYTAPIHYIGGGLVVRLRASRTP
jgi:hypothetical protein